MAAVTTVTSATFLAAYPEFDTIAAAVIDAELLKDNLYINDTAWGDYRDIALMLLIAHRLTLRFRIDKDDVLPQNMPGALTSVNVTTSGQQIQTDSVGGPEDRNFKADLQRTNYGREFLTLMDSVISPGMLA
jgi:hypothetical protein